MVTWGAKNALRGHVGFPISIDFDEPAALLGAHQIRIVRGTPMKVGAQVSSDNQDITVWYSTRKSAMKIAHCYNTHSLMIAKFARNVKLIETEALDLYLTTWVKSLEI